MEFVKQRRRITSNEDGQRERVSVRDGLRRAPRERGFERGSSMIPMCYSFCLLSITTSN